MNYEAFADKLDANSWRVEAIDFENEGVVYVSVFFGPRAKERAEEYAQWQNGIKQQKPVLKAS